MSRAANRRLTSTAAGRAWRALLLLGAAMLAGTLGAAGRAAWAAPATPPAPTRWVTDSAGFLSPQARAGLDQQLEAYQARTGHQVLVWIAPSTGGEALEDFTVRAFAAWRVGRKGSDDGLAIFVFADDHRVRFEVGYGLEGQVPDAIASRIIGEIMVPRLRAGDRDSAVSAGVDATLAVIDGKPWDQVFAAGAPPGATGTDLTSGVAPGAGGAAGEPGVAPSPGGRRQVHGPTSLFGRILLWIAGIIFVIILITHPSFALWLLFTLLSGGRDGGGGGGGGGGFSGGGGRSGGGGASGSW
jgi:uncharacterized protein